MNKNIFLLFFLLNINLLTAQTLHEVETFGFLNPSPIEALYVSCFMPSEYKTVPFNCENPIINENDTFKIPEYHFFPAIYDTTGWDTVQVFEKYVYYRLKVEVGKDTTELHFQKNGKEIWISAPVFETIYKKQELVAPYWVWTNPSKRERASYCINANPADCFVLCLKKKSYSKWFISKELKIPAKMRIREGAKDTIFEIFPPFPYLETHVIPTQYVRVPKLQKIQMARIDTTWKTFICEKEARLDSTHKLVLIHKASVTEFHNTYCNYDLRHNLSVKMIQKILQRKGFYKGEISDEINAEARAALIEFQKARNLPLVGKLDIDTINELEIRDEDD